MADETATRLLRAAEHILIEQGAHALTVRHVGKVAGLNPTLVTYHFGGIAGLTAELCRLNLAPMMTAWEALAGDAPTLRQVLSHWLGPLLQPAVFTPAGRALVVLDEIAARGDADVSQSLLDAMITMSGRVQAAVRPFLPHLDSHELRARLRFVSGAALGPPPRSRRNLATDGSEPLDRLHYLVRFAEAALLGDARQSAGMSAPVDTLSNEGA